MNKFWLKRQLRKQATDTEETQALADIATQLTGAAPNLSNDAKAHIAADIGFKPRATQHVWRYATGGAFMALLILVFVAQSAQPGSVLYALKRGSEEVRVLVQPGFTREDVQRRREEEQRREDQTTNTMSEDDSPHDETHVDDNSHESESRDSSGSDDTHSPDDSDDSIKSENSGSGSTDSSSNSGFDDQNIETNDDKSGSGSGSSEQKVDEPDDD